MADGSAPAWRAAGGARRQGRESALQAIYLSDLTGATVTDLPEQAWIEPGTAPRGRQFARHLAEGVLSMREEIDGLIRRYAENWEIKRMAAIDRCVLRLAAFEILREAETPISVIINEAVEIAKRYSTADSGKFVNGILDQMKAERPKPQSEMP